MFFLLISTKDDIKFSSKISNYGLKTIKNTKKIKMKLLITQNPH
jgi:hypothetical protein